jgi:cytochrome c oxidase cbb3-type subunit I/II
MIDARSVSPGSNMPPFPRLVTDEVNLSQTAAKMHALQSIGVPYEAREIATAASDAESQGAEIAKNLSEDGVAGVDPRSEMVALIAYLQRLGKHAEPAHGPDVATLTR